MSKQFRVDIPMWATAYIQADSEEHAMEIARKELLDQAVYAHEAIPIGDLDPEENFISEAMTVFCQASLDTYKIELGAEGL